VRCEWIGRNPFELAEPMAAPRSELKPPTAEQAAAISAEAWRDLDWGMMVWLYVTTGGATGRGIRRCCTDGWTLTTGSPCATYRHRAGRPS
jgi:hypothetical protein